MKQVSESRSGGYSKKIALFIKGFYLVFMIDWNMDTPF